LNRLYDTILASQSEVEEDELANIVENTLKFLSGPNWFKILKDAREKLDGQRPERTIVPIAEMFSVGGTERVLQAMDRIDDFVAKKLYITAMEETMLAIEYAPTYLTLHLRLGQILVESGNVEAGLEKLHIVAKAHLIRGEIPQATDTYKEILRIAPINTPARSRLIELLALQDRNDEALEQYLELTEIFRQMAEIDAARTALTNALRLAQNTSVSFEWSLKLLHQIGDIDLSRLDWRRALLIYEQIRTIDPGDEKARGNAIDLNLRLGQEDQAASELDSYLEYLVKNDRGAEALNLLEDLTREHPGKQALHARLAEAYRAADRKADAIAQYDALGEIQLDAGNIQEAIQTVKTIIDLEPPDIEGYHELLNSLKGAS
jgi:tetratricopeptide (TPR) repeat protein